jgi:hypothetical protein
MREQVRRKSWTDSEELPRMRGWPVHAVLAAAIAREIVEDVVRLKVGG